MHQLWRTTDALDRLADLWRGLWQRTAPRAPMLELNWVRQWWQLHHHEGELFVIVVHDERGTPVAIAPLYRRASTLRQAAWLRTIAFLGTGEDERDEAVGEYNSWLAAPGAMSLATREVAAVLAAEARLWDRVRLERLRRETGIDAELPGLLAGAAHTHEEAATPTFRSPVMPLEQYLAALPSANFRHRCRRALKTARELGVELVRAEEPALRGLLFEELRRLHQQRWSERGKPGAFASPVFTAFQRALLEAPAAEEGSWLLGLRAPNEGQSTRLLAVRHCLRAGDRLYDYVSGVDTKTPTALAPGLVLHLLTIQACVDAGIRHYDLMGGDYEYKRRLGLVEDHMPTLDFFARSARARSWLAARHCRRGLALLAPLVGTH